MLNLLYSISVAESLVCVMNTVLYSLEDSCTLFKSIAYMFWLKSLLGLDICAREYHRHWRLASLKYVVCFAFALLHCGPYVPYLSSYNSIAVGGCSGKFGIVVCQFPQWRSKLVEVINFC